MAARWNLAASVLLARFPTPGGLKRSGKLGSDVTVGVRLDTGVRKFVAMMVCSSCDHPHHNNCIRLHSKDDPEFLFADDQLPKGGQVPFGLGAQGLAALLRFVLELL